MNKVILVSLMTWLCACTETQACSDEEFKTLDKAITDNQKLVRDEKISRLNIYMQQIKTIKNLSDRELFEYRTKVLNNPKARKLREKGRKITIQDMLQVAYGKDCEKLKRWSDESMISANEQWDIVFKDIEKDLK